jgi:hypothetical protein
MKHHVDRGFEQRKLSPHRFAHPPLDAVAVHRLAHRLAYGEADARSVRACAAHRSTVRAECRAQREEVAHLFGELLAAGLVDALVVGVLAQAAGGPLDLCLGWVCSGHVSLCVCVGERYRDTASEIPSGAKSVLKKA